MATIAGTYKNEKNENLDEFLKAQGIGMVKRKLATSVYPTMEIQFDGTTFTQITKTAVKNSTLTFKIGEPFDQTFEELGVTKRMTITKEGDEFITTDETGDKVGLRKFTAEGLEMHMFKGDIVAKRIFKRV